MSEACLPKSAALSTNERSEIDRAVRAARDEGRTRWVACVRAVDSIDVLGGYARVSDFDRFYWERTAAKLRFFAFGRADEIESAGRERFGDVEVWADQVRERIDWIGDPREPTAPLLLGGFGFEETAPPDSKWKAFPAARFVLPAVMGEVSEGAARWIWVVRVEPGSTREQVERAIEERFDATRSVFEAGDPEAIGHDESSAAREELAPSSMRTNPLEGSGPSYRVQSDRAHSAFEAQVKAAIDEIGRGEFSKVVLARSLRVDHDGRLGIAGFMRRLRDAYPSCTFFAMGRGEDTFLAATPETLVRLRGDRVTTAALAGSAPRGRTPDEDQALADGLLSSAKEREEHAHVVDALRAVLVERCDALSEATPPKVRQLFGIQHLETRLEGRLAERSGEGLSSTGAPSILSLVAALHPTPAVCGAPREKANEWLRRFEGLERGWYAAPVGWLDASGGGDFSVALRSALIQNAVPSRAWLFAGAGIVAGSLPDAELVETRIKLRALLAPLTEI